METRARSAAKRRRLLQQTDIEDVGGGSRSQSAMPGSSRPSSHPKSTPKPPSRDTCASDLRTRLADGPTFPKFTQLPPELRIDIWQIWRQMSMQPPHPLRVRLYRGHERAGTNAKRGPMKMKLRLTAMPDLAQATFMYRRMLCICREARYEFLRALSGELVLDRGSVLRFDPKRDIIFLDIRNTRVIEDLVYMRLEGEAPDFTQAISHIGFEMAPRLPHWSFQSRTWLDPRLDFILCFPNLHSISLVSFGSFEYEVDWNDDEDVSWFLSRAHNHYLRFRSFPALEGVDYKKQTTIGRRASVGNDKHDCVICTIHKCVYVRDFLRNVHDGSGIVDRPKLTDKENRWLAGLSFNTLLMSHPCMNGNVIPYMSERTAADRALRRQEEEALEKVRKAEAAEAADSDSD